MLRMTRRLMLVGVAAVSLAAAPVTGRAQEFTILTSVPSLGFPFFVHMMKELKAEADSLGVGTVESDGQNSTPKQTADVEAAVIQGLSGIVISPSDVNAMAPALQTAVDNGVPVVTIDRRVDGVPGIIAHGMLNMAFLSRVVTGWVPQSQLRRLETRFAAMAFPGDTVVCRGEVSGKREDVFAAQGVNEMPIAANEQRLLLPVFPQEMTGIEVRRQKTLAQDRLSPVTEECIRSSVPVRWHCQYRFADAGLAVRPWPLPECPACRQSSPVPAG